MRFFIIVSALVGTAAWSHIKLTAPPSFQVTDFLGNPQKDGPCGGPGTDTNAITTVEAGSTLEVTWKETIFHPGHFRLSIARAQSDLVSPVPTIVGNNCESASIQTSPQYPTVVDGLFPHTQAQASYNTTITVPQMSCERCTLQLLQFMASHAPPCFYYQCATLRIVAPALDGGLDAGTADPGQQTPDGGLPNPQLESRGCGCHSTADVSLIFGLFAFAALRTRRGRGDNR